MTAEAMRANVAALLKGIDRYNPENLATLESYVCSQSQENVYDLEANLAVLKLYQFNPNHFHSNIAAQIMLKALTNLPHTDFVLCKCLIDGMKMEDEPFVKILEVADLLETCQFRLFWQVINNYPDIIASIVGFEDSIRKFICHVVSITYQTIEKVVLQELLGGIPESQVNQWVNKYGWKDMANGDIFINNKDESIKTKNIREQITFDSVAGIMANKTEKVAAR